MRVRLRFQKLGKVRWTSHRDVARMWERACRRMQVPLAWTGGFSPRPKLSFGLALPTGAESLAEYLDMEVAPDAEVDVAALPELLSPALPVGIDVTAAIPLEPRTLSLQEDVHSCTWRLGFAPGVDLPTVVDRALASSSLLVERERKGRLSVDDVRPAILALSADADATAADGEAQLEALLATQPRALRPQELLRALDPDLEATWVCRTHQWIERDGLREEPLAVAPHAAWARAQ